MVICLQYCYDTGLKTVMANAVLNATIVNVINTSLMSILVLVWSPNLQLN